MSNGQPTLVQLRKSIEQARTMMEQVTAAQEENERRLVHYAEIGQEIIDRIDKFEKTSSDPCSDSEEEVWNLLRWVRDQIRGAE